MKYEFGRRSFMKLGSCSVVGAIIGSQFKFASAFAETDIKDLPDNFSGDIRTHCGLCVNKCGMIARVNNGVIRKLDPIADHPKSKGMLCAKGNAGIQTVYDPDRLKYPMIRVGKRGEGKWRRATWDEALTYIADKLTEIKEKHGPEAVLFSSTEGFQEEYFLRLAEAFGSPNTVRHPTLCLASVNNAMFNTFGTVPHFDLKHADYVIFAGSNRLESLLTPDTVDMIEGKASGHYHVVLDPRFTVTASKANLWVPIKPGTDLAFALALIHMMIKENKYDKVFVEKYTHGFDKLAEHVKQYTPEWAAYETGIPVETIYKVGKDFMSSLPRSVFYSGRRGSWTENDTQFRRAIAIVNAISGAWDREGGVAPARKIGLGEMLIFPPDEPEAERIDNVKNEFPLANRRDGVYMTLREHALKEDPYPLKAWMIYKQNPLQSVPNSQKTYEMMKKMELIVSIDIIPNDTAWESDVMLPEATYLERTDPLHSLGGLEPAVALRQKVIEPMYETRPNLEIMKHLASKLDLGEYFDFTIEEWLEAQVEELPIDLDELKRRGFYADDKGKVFGKTLKEGYRFRTKTGKIELFSERYAEKGYDPLPIYKRPKNIPSGSYILLTARCANYTHSSLQNNEWLMAVGMHAMAHVNPIAAEKHGIVQGEIVILRSPYGEVELPVYITDRVHADVICMPHGFGHTSKGLSIAYNKGARGSDLLGSYYDKITGNAAMHEDFVQIIPKRTLHTEDVQGDRRKSRVKSGGITG